jgi:CMP-N,N'-diacetyllegionaminic acid synthase
MKVLCTICARSGSKGLKNKNIKNLNGKSLIFYTIESAISAKIFTNIVVSTDSLKIKDKIKNMKVSCWYLRSKKLSTDKISKLSVIQDTLKKSENKFNIKYDYICDLDVTSPLRTKKDIISSFNKVKKKNIDNVVSACYSRKNPFFNIVSKRNGKYKIVIDKKRYTRRQDAPKCFDLNASIYFWKRKALIKNKKIVGKKTALYVMPRNKSVDIDTIEDFKYVEYLMKNNAKF